MSCVWRRASSLLVLASIWTIVSGTNACQKDYFFAEDAAIPTTEATATDDGSGGIITRTPTATDTEEPTETPTTTATVATTATPSPTGTAGTQARVNFKSLMSDVQSDMDHSNAAASAKRLSGAKEAGTEGTLSNWLGQAYAGGDSSDSDGDGFIDSLENDHGSDPNDPQSVPRLAPTSHLSARFLRQDDDADGLSNTEERSLGTDPQIADSDGDGCNDGAEVLSGSNPLDQRSTPADTDGDCLSDSYEKRVGTNPLAADTDSDKVSDSVELALGSNPQCPDSDGDGILDWKEIELGSDPIKAEGSR